jgi:hypothetical protein
MSYMIPKRLLDGLGSPGLMRKLNRSEDQTVSGKSAEQEARDLLEQYGVEDAQSLSAGDVIELANLIADAHAYRRFGRPVVS